MRGRVLVALAFGAAAGESGAQAAGSFEVGAFGRWFRDAARPAVSRADVVGGGARLGIALADRVSVELSGAYGARAGQRRTVVHARARVTPLAVGRVALHGAAGLAAAQRLWPSRNSDVGLHGALGGQLPLEGGLGVRADLTGDVVPRAARGGRLVDLGLEAGLSWTPRVHRPAAPVVAPAPGPPARPPAPRDSDGDGVLDPSDACADTPGGAAVDDRGCELPAPPRPAPRDGDADGITDDIDRCPDTPAGARVDPAGCVVLAFVGARRALVLEGVNFVTGRADLAPASEAVLARVAQSLVAHDSVRVEVGGHTDSTGRAATNHALSRRRAETVRAFLVARGVAPSRVEARGYGPSRPVATNRTADGRARNRRVELRRLP